MTTYLSLPGRCLVLMPGSDSAGISRKIVGEERRSALREIMSGFSIPEGIGYIIRTASADITKTVLQKDLRYLLRLWKEIKKRGQTMKAPALIYEEQDTVVRFLRDHFSPDISEILVDTEESLEQVKQFVELLPAKQRKVRVKLHRGAKPIFNQNNVEEQIESIYKPEVPLPSGGSIVINPTEALVAIDVNSGRTSKNGDFEETIFLANMEAAAELARQLRLRDLGGLIVVDFIDMRNKKHIREVEKQVKASMKRDKAKVDISRISRFGLMQISRQKMGAPIEKGSYLPCEHCQGRGVVKSVESQALYILRRIQTGILRKKVHRIECSLPLDVANYLLNKKRKELAELEARHSAVIDVLPKPEMRPGENQIEYFQT
jgi:ribonuclease E